MIDQLQFLVSRGLGPIGNFAILAVVGLRFGRIGIADYTYAMVVCGSLYFVVGFALQTYVAVQPREATHRKEILWVRLLTVALSCLIAAVAAASGSEIWFIVAGLWLLKAGEMLFEPVVIFAALADPNDSRGRKVFQMELIRFLLVQFLIWGAILVCQAPLGVSLAVAGIGNLLIGAYFLVTFPSWTHHTGAFREWWPILKGIVAACLPMAVSGAILATVLGMPRLLMDHQMTQDQRALMGIAQVGSSVMALVFNAIWVYDLRALRTACTNTEIGKIFRHNSRLSLTFGAMLIAVALLLWIALAYVRVASEFLRSNAGILALMLVVLTLPHCISLHRDVLKLLDRSWLEVWILVASLSLGLLTWYLGLNHLALGWVGLTLAIVAVSSLSQLLASFVILSRIARDPSSFR